jgi:hypothetical protein
MCGTFQSCDFGRLKYFFSPLSWVYPFLFSDFPRSPSFLRLCLYTKQALYALPKLVKVTHELRCLGILFAVFVGFCGLGHFVRSLHVSSAWLDVINTMTAVVSVFTACYLPFIVPKLLASIDETIRDLKRLNIELEASKEKKLMTFMAFLCHEIRKFFSFFNKNLCS